MRWRPLPGKPKANDVVITAVAKAHLSRVLDLVALCSDAPNWPADAWASFVQPDDEGLAVRRRLFASRGSESTFSGLIAVAVTEATSELELLLVHPGMRRRGIGRVLTEYWLQWSKAVGASEAVLEVRPSNVGAQALYRALGFMSEGHRPRYYKNPVEDALLMRLALTS